jgi:DNA-binding LacI/PurR family transcriptional regulator
VSAKWLSESRKIAMKDDPKKIREGVTSNDVALYANVSQATVSRVFRNSAKVRPETVTQVMKAVQELGYRPNAIARSLTSRQTDIIAVVSVNFDNPFYQTILINISKMIAAMGKKMMFIQTAFDQPLEDVLNQVLEYQVDGIVVFSAALSANLVSDFTFSRLPLVIFNKHFNSRGFFSVCSDNIDAGRLIADHFVERGYTSFGFISGEKLSQTSEFRFKGFSGRLKELGYDNCCIVPGNYTYSSGYEGLLAMKEKGPLPDAVFCVNDLMALGAMDAARIKMGLRVPQDIAFVGFDNLEQSGWESYDLTTVQQPLDEMVHYTENYLRQKISNADTSGGYILLKCKLIKRSST